MAFLLEKSLFFEHFGRIADDDGAFCDRTNDDSTHADDGIIGNRNFVDERTGWGDPDIFADGGAAANQSVGDDKRIKNVFVKYLKISAITQ